MNVSLYRFASTHPSRVGERRCFFLMFCACPSSVGRNDTSISRYKEKKVGGGRRGLSSAGLLTKVSLSPSSLTHTRSTRSAAAGVPFEWPCKGEKKREKRKKPHSVRRGRSVPPPVPPLHLIHVDVVRLGLIGAHGPLGSFHDGGGLVKHPRAVLDVHLFEESSLVSFHHSFTFLFGNSFALSDGGFNLMTR